MVEQQHIELIEHLDYLLRVGRWSEANAETRKIILKVAGQENKNYLMDEQIKQFPGQIISKIDSLWNNYSNGKFGFKVQKRILTECKRDPQTFGDRVGWRVQGKWISASGVIYNPTDAPEGHLPWGIVNVLTADSAVLDGILNSLYWVFKVAGQRKYQRQLIADSMDFIGSVLGDKSDKEEMKRNFEYEISQKEGWWQGERLEEANVKRLFSLLISCNEI